MSNELFDSFAKDLGRRLTTPLYGTFLVAWLFFHWKFLVVLFFVSEQSIETKIGLLKSDYLSLLIFDYQDWLSYMSWLAPFVITWLVIWKFPKWIALPAFQKEEEYKAGKKIIRILEQKKVEIKQTDLEETNVKKLEIVSERAKKEEEIVKINPEIHWPEEYNEFKNSTFFNKFRFIIDSIYISGGSLQSVPTDILAYVHANNIVEINQKEYRMSLTEKGKFFVKQFSLK